MVAVASNASAVSVLMKTNATQVVARMQNILFIEMLLQSFSTSCSAAGRQVIQCTRGVAAAGLGAMVAPLVFLEPNMMGFVLIYAFAGALLGGIDNPWGAVIGGFAMGVLENIMGVYVVGTELKLTVALVIIVGVLVIRPSGIFGRAVVTRV